MRPVDVVLRLCPRAKASYIAAFEAADPDFSRYAINTKKRVAGFLSQMMAETGGFALEYESGDYTAKRIIEIFGSGHSAKVTSAEALDLAHNGPKLFERVYGLGNPSMARRLGNTQPGDGYRYRGTGPMQMTGRDNFKHIGNKIGADLENRPQDALLPQYLLLPAFIEWDENQLNGYADAGDVLAISRAINLGDPASTRTPNGMPDRQDYYRRCLNTIDTIELIPQTLPPLRPVLPLLKRGSKGDEVRRLQNWLGFSPPQIDGDFGPITETAVKAFQTKHNLVDSGIVDQGTWKALSGYPQ